MWFDNCIYQKQKYMFQVLQMFPRTEKRKSITSSKLYIKMLKGKQMKKKRF